MKLSDMRELLDARGIQLTKSLGQNFLHDQNQLRRITAAGALQPGDQVLEIGPGLGPLTEHLIAQAGSVLAVEKDERLVAVLRERFAHVPHLELRHDDALVWLQNGEHDFRGWKLIANLPYAVASPILVELADGQGPDLMVATLQLEVARRIAAGVGTDDYGLLTLLLGLHYEVTGQFRIPATCFFPAPDVTSACITLRRRADCGLTLDQQKMHRRMVKLAFSQRRKMMIKLLRQQWPAPTLETAFQTLSLHPQIRAEAVNREQFVELVKLLTAG